MARSGRGSTVHRPEAGGASGTRAALIGAAIGALREDGYAGASARAIARRAGCTQALVFYHFGSVVNLLLAALDQVATARMAHYRAAVDRAGGPAELVEVARAIFEEDLDAGHIAVLAEMIAGTSSTPGLAAEVATRLEPWRAFAAGAVAGALAGSPLASMAPPDEVGHGVVALYLGLEMLAHLDGDRTAALRLFDRAGELARLLEALAPRPDGPAGAPPAADRPSRRTPA
ncbi:MAG: TetR family transcriptional regulator, partial [Acidimicrobiales bacterium]